MEIYWAENLVAGKAAEKASISVAQTVYSKDLSLSCKGRPTG